MIRVGVDIERKIEDKISEENKYYGVSPGGGSCMSLGSYSMMIEESSYQTL